MYHIKRHMQAFRNSLALIVLLFALSPCSVKQSLHHVLELSYTKPLNKSKVVLSAVGSCPKAGTVHLLKSVKYQHNVLVPITPFADLSFTAPFSFQNPKQVKLYTETVFNLNRLPKYILFKRLKIAIA